MNAVSTLKRNPSTADPLTFAPSEGSCAHSEFLSVCARLANVWAQRAQSETELWHRLNLELAGTSSLAEALQIYSDNAGQRLHIALENAKRIYEEQQAIAARFSRSRD